MPKLDSHLRREVQDYLKGSGATKEERATVWQMVHEGYDYLSNPWFYAFDGGILMDLVAALRFDRYTGPPVKTTSEKIIVNIGVLS